MNKDCFTPKVLEADCDNTPITFLTEEIEEVDDIANPPQNGAHRNLIVKYLMTGHIYLYNSAGIPILLNESSVVDAELSLDSINPVQNKVITKALNDETEARETNDDELQQSIENVESSLTTALETETTNRENADNALQQKIENVDDALNTALDGLETKLDRDVINSIEISSNTSTDVLVLEDGKVNLWTGSTNTHEVPIPVASPTSAGVMNAATYNAVAENSNKITNILQSSVAVNGLSATPTQDDLTTAWKAASGETELINGARIRDIDNSLDWTYYSNLNQWVSAAAGGTAIFVNTWTNNAAGIVKGSEEPGQIYAESDGTGSVNGWDTVKSDIANNASNITTLNTTVTGHTSDISSLQTAVAEKQDTLVSGTNIKTINNESILGEGNLEIDAPIRIASCPITYHSKIEPNPIPRDITIIDTITVPTDFLSAFELGEEFYISLNKGTLVKTSGYITSDTKVLINGIEYDILVDDPTGSSGVTSPVERQISVFFERIYKVRLTDASGSDAVQLLGIENDSTSQNAYLQTYPIGSIYISVNSDNPSTYFPGTTWEAFATGKTLIGVDPNDVDFDEALKTGGEKEHTLTERELPKSTWVSSSIYAGGDSAYNTNGSVNSGSYWGFHGGLKNQQPINNLQPYITVYIWVRTA